MKRSRVHAREVLTYGCLVAAMTVGGCWPRGLTPGEPTPPRASQAGAGPLRQLQDGDADEQILAARALANANDRRAIPPLMAHVATGPDRVRIAAAQALGRLRAREAIGVLGETLARAEAPYVRAAAGEALGMIGDPQAIPALLAGLDDSHPIVVRDVVDALAAMGPPAVEWLGEILAGESLPARRAALRTLRKIDAPEARAMVNEATQRQEPAGPAEPGAMDEQEKETP